MRKLLLLLPCLVPLCGFAQAPFDADAVPRASTARKQAIDACGARTDFKSSDQVIDCVVAADSGFAHAIHLGDARILDGYLAGVKTLDAGIVAGRVKPDEIAKTFRGLQDGFFKAIKDRDGEYQASLEEDLASGAGQAHPAPGMSSSMDMMNNMGGMPGAGN